MANNYGLNDDYRYIEFHLDSLDTPVTNNSSFDSTDNPLFIMTTPYENIVAMKVLEVQIPFSFYIINSSTNTFGLLESVGGVSTTVTIPVGYYNATTLATATGLALTATSLAIGNNTGAGWTYTVVYSALTGKFTFTSTQSSGSFTLAMGQFAGSETSPRGPLGFPQAPATTTFNYISSVQATPALVSPNVASVGGPNYMYLNCDKYGSQLDFALPSGATALGAQGATGSQIAKIPINVQPGGVIYWSDPGKMGREYLTPRPAKMVYL